MTTDAAPTGGPPPLTENDFPYLYRLADATSTTGRDKTFWRNRWYLIALTVGAFAGAITWTVWSQDVMGWVAVAAFLASTGFTLWLAIGKPDESWYQGRAAAESVKTLTWCYVTGADPFPLAATGVDRNAAAATRVDRAFIDRLRQVVAELSHVDATVTAGDQITPRMRALRSSSFNTRRDAYITGRIEDQRNWYAAKAAFHRKRGRQLISGAAASSVIGLFLGFLRIEGVINVDLLGLFATVGAALVAESQLRQHNFNASAYILAAQELGMIATLAKSAEAASWPRLVGEAEEAISREHTMWCARNGIVTMSDD